MASDGKWGGIVILVLGAGAFLLFGSKRLGGLPGPPASNVVSAVEQGTVPEGFTASKEQLDQLASAGVSKDSSTYREAVDYAYVKAASETKSGETVAWSSTKGYYNISDAEKSTYGLH